MKPYGIKKTNGPHIRGHQDCGICHPAQKNKKKRARAEGKRECECPLPETEDDDVRA